MVNTKRNTNLLAGSHDVTFNLFTMVACKQNYSDFVMTVMSYKLAQLILCLDSFVFMGTNPHLDARRTINITDIVTKAARNRKRKSSVRGSTSACTDATNSSRNNEHSKELPNPTSCSSWYCRGKG